MLGDRTTANTPGTHTAMPPITTLVGPERPGRTDGSREPRLPHGSGIGLGLLVSVLLWWLILKAVF